MSLVKWNNGGIIPQFSRMVENIFRDDDDFFNTWKKAMHVPAVNVKETDKLFEMEFAAPGLKKEDFVIEVKDNMLTVSCEKKEEKEEVKDNFTRKEFNYTTFNRSFWLPDNVNAEDIKAGYKDGVLKLTIPKVKVMAPEKAKMIPIS